MAIANQSKSMGFSRAKIVVIGVLSFVLVAVGVFQMRGRSPSVKLSARRKPRRHAEENTAPNGDFSAGNATLGDVTAWPDLPRSVVLKHDPFALPAALRPPIESEPAVEPQATNLTLDARARETERQRAETLIRLQQQGISLILISEQGPVARVGDDILRVGQELKGGLRVQSIGPHGMVLEEAPR